MAGLPGAAKSADGDGLGEESEDAERSPGGVRAPPLEPAAAPRHTHRGSLPTGELVLEVERSRRERTLRGPDPSRKRRHQMRSPEPLFSCHFRILLLVGLTRKSSPIPLWFAVKQFTPE